jgi:hypothetical protein
MYTFELPIFFNGSIRHIESKNLEVTIFRQCVPIGCQTKQDSKKIH